MTFPRPRRQTCPQPLLTYPPQPRAWPKRGGAGGEPAPPGGWLVPLVSGSCCLQVAGAGPGAHLAGPGAHLEGRS